MSSPVRPRIGIDARLIRQTGVGVYIRNLIHHLVDFADEFEFICFVPSGELTQCVSEYPQLSWCTADHRWHSVDEQIGFLRVVNHERLDLMHFTYFSYPLMYRRPFISTIHDLTPLLYKTGKATQLPTVLYDIKHRVLRRVLQSALQHASAIITPSESVKTTILKTFPSTLKNHIHPIYEGVNEALVQAHSKGSLPSGVKKPYLLYVGNYYPHKNVNRLIEAFAKSQADCDLVLVGPEDIFAKRLHIQISIQHAAIQDRVHMLHGVKDEELATLYREALALIHPALDEGFGLTLAEAQALGTPILASDIPVFHELFADGFVPFDPYEVESIAAVISHAAAHPPKTTALKKDYSFKRMAAETVALYRDVLKSNG